MTINEFFQQVENLMIGGWRAKLDGQKIEVQRRPGSWWVSPVEAVHAEISRVKQSSRVYGTSPQIAAQRLGLPKDKIDNLVSALMSADGEPSLRRRLLKACGLKEAK